MNVSEDPTTGTNQKVSVSLMRIHILYNKIVHKENEE